MTWKNLPNKPTPPVRKPQGYGTSGRKIVLRTNHFKVNIGNKHLVIFHYDVTIKDFSKCEDIPKKKKMRIFEAMQKSFPLVFKEPLGFDSQKNAYSVKDIPQFSKKPTTYNVVLRDESRPPPKEEDKKRTARSTYTVTLVKVNSATLQDLFSAYSPQGGSIREASNIIQMCEVMFRHYRSHRFEQVGPRSFYSLSNEFGIPFNVSHDKEGQVGFFASLRPASWKGGLLTMNIDTTYTAFHKELDVLDLLKENFHLRDNDFNKPLRPDNIYDGNKLLKGLRIRTLHSLIPRTYKVLEITKRSAKALTFLKESGNVSTKMSVAEYFAKDLNRRLKYPEFNCLHVGNPEKTNYIPIEFCRIDKGQRVQKKLTDLETREFIKSTAVPPNLRMKKIKDIVRVNDLASDPVLKALTFTISDQPLVTEGRVLPAPSLLAKKTQIQPRDGKWNATIFHDGAVLKEWAVINYDNRTREQVVGFFIDKMVSLGTQMGMQISRPFDTFQAPFHANPAEDIKYYKEKNPKIQLIFCVINNKTLYGKIKLAGDRNENIITQCILSKNVEKCQETLVRNILLKMNAKMGGTHTVCGPRGFSVDILQFDRPILVMGADVNHPAAGDSTMPSLAAVVGSLDKCAARYAVEVRAQNHRVEIIEDMTQITINLLKSFYKKTGSKPERIIMYRDGVSESQFEEVLASEMKKMRDGCTRLDKNYTPGITFLCVQKRHHTRLFCDEKDGVGRHKNVPPGTIVDRDVTHPKENDFFLCSHEGIQGTSRPTHYHLLWDDNDIPIESLQMITYKLCHVYSRCTRAVSIPTPAYYAHLAAFRAKTHIAAYLESRNDNMEGDQLFDHISKRIVNTMHGGDCTLHNELYYV